jgi:hypothetical protein
MAMCQRINLIGLAALQRCATLGYFVGLSLRTAPFQSQTRRYQLSSYARQMPVSEPSRNGPRLILKIL